MEKKGCIIAVIDGQGGGLGRNVIESLKKELPGVTIRALGTNAAATQNMMRGGATDGATGENAIIVNAKKARIIVGAAAITVSNALLGEITPKMAEAIGSADALKILVPMNRCHIKIAVPNPPTMQESIACCCQIAKEYLEQDNEGE